MQLILKCGILADVLYFGIGFDKIHFFEILLGPDVAIVFQTFNASVRLDPDSVILACLSTTSCLDFYA